MIVSLIATLSAATFVAIALPRVLMVSLRKRLFDPIDPRKVHNVPASRLGGITFFPAMLFAVWIAIALTNTIIPVIGPHIDFDTNMVLVSLALLLLYATGIYDDLVGVKYRSKFMVQIIAALLVINGGAYFKTLHGFCGIDEIPVYIGIPITAFFYVFVTNAINLIDGIDGLASMLSIMALAVYGMLMYSNGLYSDTLIAAALLGALIPFWYGNVFGVRRGVRSKIFMGDTGALVIGAALGYMAVTTWNITIDRFTRLPIDQIYYVLAFTMLLVPCFDVVRIVIHRFMTRRPLFLPDKNHIHHKFMALGFTPRRALLCIIAMNIIFMAINIGLSYWINFTFVVFVDIAIWTAMHIIITRKVRGRNAEK